MISTDAIRTIAGIIGNVISIGWFVSPIPTYYRIYKKDAVHDFPPDHYLLTILNCALYVHYGILKPNNLLFSSMNGIGLIIEFIYVALYLIYASKKQRQSVRKKSVCGLLFYLVVVVLITPFLNCQLWRDLAIEYLGYLCINVNYVTLTALCNILEKVYETTSVERISFWPSLFSFLNGVCWSTYAWLRWDPNIFSSSFVLCLLGIIQLSFYAYDCRRYPQSKNSTIHDEKVAGDELRIPLLDDMV
ncbi:hypothetical protein MKW94_017445 [Papaver nudicaule]|uniref:Bidirectional sugar transporter SWEET n=1 Tax=Papaver nudicaule TaxID=74823 RepID=A0AA41SC24_PAPNU|nr:hypothetical protein [Papaver nudicaule]